MPVSTFRYKSQRQEYLGLLDRMHELAQRRRNWSAQSLYERLRLEGFRVNHKRVERLSRREGLSLRKKRNKRRKGQVAHALRETPTRPMERLAMDFVTDAVADRRRFRVLCIHR